MAKIEANISLEKIIHDALRELAQNVSKNGVMIESVGFTWLNRIGLEPVLVEIGVRTVTTGDK